MLIKQMIVLTFATVFILQIGCTSIVVRNQTGDSNSNRVIYPGARQDAELVVFPFVVAGAILYGLVAMNDAPEQEDAHFAFGLAALPFAVIAGCYGLVDLPLSAAADTVMFHSDMKAVDDKKTQPQPTSAGSPLPSEDGGFWRQEQ
jgi:uncharacterized protein YceK